jgi:hypothetical protein
LADGTRCAGKLISEKSMEEKEEQMKRGLV